MAGQQSRKETGETMTTTIVRPSEPLRAEHRELLPHIEALRSAADAAGNVPAGATAASVDEALAFLEHDLLPHAEAEEAALYPLVERVMAAPGATDTMTADHARIGQLIAELADVRRARRSGGAIAEYRRLLYSLHAIVSLHFAKEEGVYLPLLDAALTASDAERFFIELEAAAGAAKTRRKAQ